MAFRQKIRMKKWEIIGNDILRGMETWGIYLECGIISQVHHVKMLFKRMVAGVYLGSI